jgi:hypothetical protein
MTILMIVCSNSERYWYIQVDDFALEQTVTINQLSMALVVFSTMRLMQALSLMLQQRPSDDGESILQVKKQLIKVAGYWVLSTILVTGELIVLFTFLTPTTVDLKIAQTSLICIVVELIAWDLFAAPILSAFAVTLIIPRAIVTRYVPTLLSYDRAN